MAEPFIGQIELFPYTYVPEGWFACLGQSVSILQYQALYAVIGITFGGNMQQQTFQLPNLQGSVAVCQGQGSNLGPGLTPYVIGNGGGAPAVTLNSATMLPPHTHTFNAATPTTATLGNSTSPSNTLFAKGQTTSGTKHPPFDIFTTAAPNMTLFTDSVSPSPPPPAVTAAHDNRQPYLVLPFCIAWNGIFPIRP